MRIAKRLVLVSGLAAGVVPIGACTQQGPPVDSNPVLTAQSSPPPISGGTLVIARDGRAVMADSDRDLVWAADLDAGSAVSVVKLAAHDEPGRLVEDGAGRFHVVLRRGGAVATIDLATSKVVDRTAVCPAPRGIAYDAQRDEVHVACAGGELVSLPAAGGAASRTLRLEGDLRDVVVTGHGLFVSRFRAAELLDLDTEGGVRSTSAPPVFQSSDQSQVFQPTVAWRTIGLPDGTVAMLHQRSLNGTVQTSEGGYGAGGCNNSIVHGTVTVLGGPVAVGSPGQASPILPGTILAVDLAVQSRPGELRFAVVSAGNDSLLETSPGSQGQLGDCSSPTVTTLPDNSGPVAVAADRQGRWIVQTREPAAIYVVGQGQATRIASLPTAVAGEWPQSVADSGHDLFHRNQNGQSLLACASCHPEGREDGHVWTFDKSGPRKTPAVGGGLLATAPYHWEGDLSDLGALMDEVFVKRMGGVAPGPRHVAVFGTWLDGLPSFPPSPTASAASIARGAELFRDPAVGCAGCHSGPKYTNNATVDVGTGRPFQVPSLLGLSGRAPYMHDGCAKTIADRFGPCGGDRHGQTSHLSPADVTSVVGFLGTL